MSKRVFTSPDKWDKSWYRKLPPKIKCLWSYITERCDQAGVWEADFELASFYIGDTVTVEDISFFDERIIPFGKNKYRIVGYIYFQQNLANSEGGVLNPKRLAHIPIIKIVKAHGFIPEMGKDAEEEEQERKDKEPVPLIHPLLEALPKIRRKEIIERKQKERQEKAASMKDEVFEGIFSNERYMETISKLAEGKNVNEAFEECWNYHSLQPSPPTEVWVWKQKFLTWITNKKNYNNVTTKSKNRSRTDILIESFNNRVEQPPSE